MQLSKESQKTKVTIKCQNQKCQQKIENKLCIANVEIKSVQNINSGGGLVTENAKNDTNITSHIGRT